jgi:hypothetical protein
VLCFDTKALTRKQGKSYRISPQVLVGLGSAAHYGCFICDMRPPVMVWDTWLSFSGIEGRILPLENVVTPSSSCGRIRVRPRLHKFEAGPAIPIPVHGWVGLLEIRSLQHRIDGNECEGIRAFAERGGSGVRTTFPPLLPALIIRRQQPLPSAGADKVNPLT